MALNIDVQAASKLFSIKKNQIKMVRRRGYNIEKNEEELLFISLQEFLDAYIPFARQQKKSLRSILSRPYYNDKGETLIVYYADAPTETKQLGKETVTDAISMVDRAKSKNLILITPVSLSPKAKKDLEDLETYNIYTFLENEMGYDPTEHYFTPEHKALSTEEQREFLKSNNLSLDQLPIILTSDMIVRYYGFRPGQVIQINRTNLFSTLIQNSISYRAVKADI